MAYSDFTLSELTEKISVDHRGKNKYFWRDPRSKDKRLSE
jgi:hypothetical protein